MIFVVCDVFGLHRVADQSIAPVLEFALAVQILDVLISVATVTLEEQQGVFIALITKLDKLRVSGDKILVGDHDRIIYSERSVLLLRITDKIHFVLCTVVLFDVL